MEQVVERKKGRKYDQVVEGARQVFMSDGFEGASVDTIAKCAGVSKATLYSYFPDKRLLFMEVATCACRRQADEVVEQMDFDRAPRDILRQAGEGMLDFMLSETGQRVFRICVAECDRFPELGQYFWESGPGMVEALLCRYFEASIARGELAIPDLRLAAHQFAELCKAQAFTRLCFGMQAQVDAAERDYILDSALDTWLARYAT